MMLFKTFYEQFLSWQFWLVCFGLLLISWHQTTRNSLLHKSQNTKINSNAFYFFSFLIILLSTFPYWIDGSKSAIGGIDDTWFLLTTRTQVRTSKESMLWLRMLAGGNDFNLLQLRPLSIFRIYPYFLNVWQEYAVIMITNMIFMFVFTYKMLIDCLKCEKWFAFWGSILCALTQGFWSEGKWPDGHAAYGYGMTLAPMIFYLLYKSFKSRYVYLLSILLGVFFSCMIHSPIITGPVVVITIALWLMVFYSSNLKKCLLIVCLFSLAILVWNFEYILTVLQLLPLSARGNAALKTIRFLPYGWKVWGMGLLLVISILWTAQKLQLLKDRLFIKMLVLFLSFLIIPAIAYLFQESRLLNSYRWAVLFWGNQFPFIVIAVFVADRIANELKKRHDFFGHWVKQCTLLCLILTCTVWLFNNIGIGLVHSYAYGDWNYLTNNDIIKKLPRSSTEPYRVLNYGIDPDNLYLNYHDGIESAGTWASFINKNIVEFWWKHLYKQEQKVDACSITVKDLSSIHVPLLKLLNVKYVVSQQPLDSTDLEFVASSPESGDKQICLLKSPEPQKDIIDSVIYGNVFSSFQGYLKTISCLWQHRQYTPPLYLYELRNYFPRLYFAKAIKNKPTDTIIEKNEFKNYTTSKNAYVDITDGAATETSNNFFSADGTILIRKYTQDRMDLDIASNEKQFVILSEPNAPFWRLFVNGKPEKTYRTNTVQTGFFIKAGESQVNYVYCPPRRANDHLCAIKLDKILN